MTVRYDTKRVLIWGKTYPELSEHHTETVCTGGCLEDGSPVRLYPVPFRYLTGSEQKYVLYDWIEVPIARNSKDTRPESFKIHPDHIRVVGHEKTEERWQARREVIFRDRSWHFGCLQDLKEKQKETRQSLGMVAVGTVDDIEMVRRPAAEESEHNQKLEGLQSRGELFGGATKDLAFIPFRARIHWHCAGGTRCPGHSASILDWGLLELGRREGMERVRQKMEAIADLARHDLHLYVGNLFTRQQIFSCIGLWYPLRSGDREQQELAFGQGLDQPPAAVGG